MGMMIMMAAAAAVIVVCAIIIRPFEVLLVSSLLSCSPAIAGVVALVLEARPQLTWRDVQGVLINSCEVVDPEDEDWERNGAGRFVNHKYGYGKINAGSAVRGDGDVPCRLRF